MDYTGLGFFGMHLVWWLFWIIKVLMHQAGRHPPAWQAGGLRDVWRANNPRHSQRDCGAGKPATRWESSRVRASQIEKEDEHAHEDGKTQAHSNDEGREPDVVMAARHA
jgi:hypothetical protein